MIAYFQRLLEHMFWADTRLLEVLDAHAGVSSATDAATATGAAGPGTEAATSGTAAAAPGTAALAAVHRLYAHILAAERVWLLRLSREDSAVQPIRPDLGLDAMHELARRNAEGYARLLEELQEVDLTADVVYANSQGVPFRNSMSDILQHVALHGSYHRGQIATALRGGGLEPVNTDFITFARLP